MSFYVLRHPVGPEETDAESDFLPFGSRKLSGAPHCPSCGQPTGMKKWLPPYRVEVRFWGQYCGDIVFGGSNFLLSERFVGCFREEGLTGFEFASPVNVIRVKPRLQMNKMPSYFFAGIRRGAAVFDEIASEAVYERPWTCPVCRQGDNLMRLKRIALVPDTWQGEDVFEPIGQSGLYLVSDRFKSFCKQHQFKNLRLIDSTDYRVDYTFGK